MGRVCPCVAHSGFYRRGTCHGRGSTAASGDPGRGETVGETNLSLHALRHGVIFDPAHYYFLTKVFSCIPEASASLPERRQSRVQASRRPACDLLALDCVQAPGADQYMD